MAKVRVPFGLPNKANTYELHFSPIFWKAIKDIVAGIRKYYRKPLYWIGPTKEVKEIERVVGFIAKKALAEDTDQPVQVDIWISDRLDSDGVKAVLDGIELSGRIKNDRQVKELAVHKLPMKNSEFWFDISLIQALPPVDSNAGGPK